MKEQLMGLTLNRAKCAHAIDPRHNLIILIRSIDAGIDSTPEKNIGTMKKLV